ncbi:MAG: ParB/RepB/Spo0J family partition protein [Acidobacteria bacterium]|nr:ParB/RepB/Spo0J family partition protein [Acidobacteriota bacterium]MDA1233168.1 ParB/RepB/Spo0J family partition protein [Acidobacteriota bacterium]
MATNEKSASQAASRKALGRGLDALLSNRSGASAAAAVAPAMQSGEQVRMIPLDAIDPNPDQPRTVFQPGAIEELAQSIKEDGVIQPILLKPAGSRFMVVVGERRWRASKLAGLSEIPAVIRDVNEEKILEIALVENIQREDLNPIEIATALQRLANEFQLSHEELAQRTGKDRTTVTNLLRLLRLPRDLQEMVGEKKISMGHARALLSLPEEDQQRAVAERIVRQGLSVRQVEQLVKQMQEPAEPAVKPAVDPNVAAAIARLEECLGAPVRLVERGKTGRIEISYGSPAELDRLYAVLTGDE